MFQKKQLMGSIHLTMKRLMTTAIKTMKNYQRLSIGLVLSCAVFLSIISHAADFDPKFDPKQSIKFWLSSVVSSGQNTQVGIAETVFSQLLRNWDKTRIEPSLYVVKSSAGPWAASLEDGNILLSIDALELALRDTPPGHYHNLAFLLAHEISHQRADDLWQQKFFRMAGIVTPENHSGIKKYTGLSGENLRDLEHKEAQADAEALVLMSVAGFDPMPIVQDKGFFNLWASAIWQTSCESSKRDDEVFNACEQAKTRTNRALVKLNDVAIQSTLFELGTQAFVIGNYAQARKYFSAFGRNYPYAVVHENIGNTYFAEALFLKQQFEKEFEPESMGFYYPLVLSAEPDINKSRILTLVDAGKTRSLSKAQRKKFLKGKITNNLSLAVNSFEQAMKINPNYAGNYFRLALCYMLQENYYMARGILQDKYTGLFKPDDGYQLFLALIDGLQKNYDSSLHILHGLTNKTFASLSSNFLPKELLFYAANYNYLVLAKPANTKSIWKSIAAKANRENQTVLFRYAIEKISDSNNQKLNQSNKALAQRLYQLKNQNPTLQRGELWVEGNRFRLMQSGDNVYSLITDTEDKIAIWYQGGDLRTGAKHVFDQDEARLHKNFGIPSQQIYTHRGKYLSYPSYKISFFIQNGKVAGWFFH